MIGMMQKKRAENRSSNQNTHSLRDQFEARTDIELPIMNFPSSCDETTLSIMRNSRSPGASSGSGKRLRKDRVNDSTSGIQMKSFLFDADGSSQSHVPCLKGSMEEESASILSFSDSLCQRMGISGVNSCNSTRILGYVICALAIISLLTIVSLSRGNQHLLHPFSSASSSSPLSPEDIGSRITISAAAAAAFSSSHRAEDSNELNPISLDSESTTVMAEGKCSKFMGSMDEGAFSFKVRCFFRCFSCFSFSSIHLFCGSFFLSLFLSFSCFPPDFPGIELAFHVTIRDSSVRFERLCQKKREQEMKRG